MPDATEIARQAATLLDANDVDDAADLLGAHPAAVEADVGVALAVASVIDEFRSRDAATLFESVAEASERQGDWATASEAWQLAMVAWSRIQDTGAAGEAHRRAVEAVTASDDMVERFTGWVNLAARLTHAGLARESARLTSQVLVDIREQMSLTGEPRLRELLSSAAINRASSLLESGSVDEVPALLDEAEKLCSEDERYDSLGTIEVNRAMMFGILEQIEDGRLAYERAAAAFREGGSDRTNIGFALRGAAASHAKVGRISDALSLYESAREEFESVGALNEVRRTDTAILMAKASSNEHIAREDLDRYQAELVDLNPADAADRARNLGNVAFRDRDFDGALRLFEAAMTAFENLGKPVEVARVRSSRSAVYRAREELELARGDLLEAIAVLEPADAFLAAAGAHHNLALVLRDVAKRDDDEAAVGEALDNVLLAVRAIDAHRHSLPTALDRDALMAHTYASVIPLAISLASQSGDADLVAALIERARVQPVFAEAIDGEGTRFRAPAPIRARAGTRGVDGEGPTVTLNELADRIAGAGATWIGWGVGNGRTIVSCTSQHATTLTTTGDSDALNNMGLALPIPTDTEYVLADGDTAHAFRLARYRTALGPLARDLELSEMIAPTLRRVERQTVEAQLPDGWRERDDVELLWPVADALLGSDLLDDLDRVDEPDRMRIVVAPLARYGRVPWAALPVRDPRQDSPRRIRRLAEVADVVVSVPATLATQAAPWSAAGTGHVAVIDPLGDLPNARSIEAHGATIVLGRSGGPATRQTLLSALTAKPALLTIAGHIRPGSAADPASSSVLLAAPAGSDADPVTATQLKDFRVPPVVVLLGCDGAGAATGNEWTGPATGLIWGGAQWVVTTTAPVLEDPHTAASDSRLLSSIAELGPLDGLWAWQRSAALRLASEPADQTVAPLRWGGVIVTATGPRSAASGVGR